MRHLTARYDVRLQRKLFVTRPLGEESPNPTFRVALDGFDIELILWLDDLPRSESPNRGIVVCQVSRVQIRVARAETLDVPSLVPIPEDGPELQAWNLALGRRMKEYS